MLDVLNHLSLLLAFYDHLCGESLETFQTVDSDVEDNDLMLQRNEFLHMSDNNGESECESDDDDDGNVPQEVLNGESAGAQYNQARSNDEQQECLNSLLMPWNESLLNFPIVPVFNGSSKLSETLHSAELPIHFFDALFDIELLKHIVLESNKYAKENI